MPDSTESNPPRAAIRIANILFALGAVFSIIAVAYAAYKIFTLDDMYITPRLYYICIGVFVLSATFFGFSLQRLNNHLKVNLSVLLVAIGVTVYGFETYLEFSFETRTKMEVLEDLNDSGVTAFPNIAPNMFLPNGLVTNGGSIYPLGGISNIVTILTNEAGYYPIINTDEHGFNNPKGLYDSDKVDIVLTGDSYAEGYSVYSNKTIGAALRKSGFHTISVGKGGNGALIELATLKEYAEPLKPKIVLWLYYLNDLYDMEREKRASLLKKYLDEDGFSQHLILRQGEIDDALINYVQGEWDKQRRNEDNWVIKKLSRVSKLVNLRSRLGLSKPSLIPKRLPQMGFVDKRNGQARDSSGNMQRQLTNPQTPMPSTQITAPTSAGMFLNILQKSKQMVAGWGGEMYFVYLPGFYQYFLDSEHLDREFVIHVATELDIPVIDIHREVFALRPDPLSLFPFRRDGHYNAEGYRLVAEAIARRLRADGALQ
jgi:hypothetical protein